MLEEIIIVKRTQQYISTIIGQSPNLIIECFDSILFCLDFAQLIDQKEKRWLVLKFPCQVKKKKIIHVVWNVKKLFHIIPERSLDITVCRLKTYTSTRTQPFAHQWLSLQGRHGHVKVHKLILSQYISLWSASVQVHVSESATLKLKYKYFCTALPEDLIVSLLAVLHSIRLAHLMWC